MSVCELRGNVISSIPREIARAFAVWRGQLMHKCQIVITTP